MRTANQDIPVVMNALGAVARFQPDFGTAVGTLAAEHYQLQAGVDIAPLLVGLERDQCQVPHWGYVVSGQLTVSYGDGASETCRGGELVHWPAGHSVRAEEDSELVLFSPEVDHRAVINHMSERLATLPA